VNEPKPEKGAKSMLHSYGNVGDPYRDYVNRAHDERARLVSALLAGAATGLETLAGTAGRGLERVGRSVLSGVATARRRRAAIRQLNALDDRMLKDIGISRGEIQYVVDGQLSAERAATQTPPGHGEIARFPVRKAAVSGANEPLGRAA
jgi:uncharacterized protein YjiS (DUF1127 family)